MASDNNRFQFHPVPRDILGSLKNKSREAIELLEKWGMLNRMKFMTFTFNRNFQLYQGEAFAMDFFSSEAVQSAVQVLSSGGWTPLNTSSVGSMSVEEVTCTALSMDLFDRLHSSGVVRPTGHIVKCFDETVDGFLVSDELRKTLLMEESDHHSQYSPSDRQQLLFRIFQHLVLGGPINQYEDEVSPYLNITQLLYKELVQVVRDPLTKKLSIPSKVLSVKAKGDVGVVFPGSSQNPQNFCYFIIDNVKRHVTVWYHLWD